MGPSKTTNTDVPPGYNDLPLAVQQYVSPKEYAWMGAEMRAGLVEDLTMPDVEG